MTPPATGGTRRSRAGDPRRAASPRMIARASSRRATICSSVRASTLSRSSGSVLELRTFSHQSGPLTVSPSTRSASPTPLEPDGDRVDHRGLVVDGRAELARRGVPGVARDELRQRLVAAPRDGHHVQRGEHARVRAPELAEVVVRRVLAAEDGVVLRHRGLDEGVAHLGDDRRAAVLLDDLRHRARGDLVDDDRRPGCRASSWLAIRAVTVEGLTTSPRSSMMKQRSASPSKTSARSAPRSRTAAWASRRFSGTSGFAGWLGKFPSGSV